MYNAAQGKPGNEELKVLEAKQFPIGDLIPNNNGRRQSGKLQMFRCPLPGHEDRTESFAWYSAENRWWCFGENKGGDSIDLVMALEGLSFKDAVKRLT